MHVRPRLWQTNGTGESIVPPPLPPVPSLPPAASPQQAALSWRIGGVVALVLLALGLLAGKALTPGGCASKDQLAELQTLAAQGKSEVVVSLADLYLSNRSTCPKETELALAAVRYQAAREELFQHPELSDQTLVVRWREDDARAASAGVPAAQRSPMTVFAAAYNARRFEWARAAYLQAWSEGLVGPQDLQNIAKYGAALYNGSEMLLTKNGQDAHGRALMSTACALDRAYALYQGVACQTMRERFGADEQTWPAPLSDDPVLAAAK